MIIYIAAYSIYKKQCNDSGCGPLCDADIGCMNYHINSSYLIEVQCSDGYGSKDTATLTFQVEENTPPVLNNLPGNFIEMDLRI